MRAVLWAGAPHLAHIPTGFCLLLMLALYYEDSWLDDPRSVRVVLLY